MVHNEYGKRDLDIANNARMSNSLDPNSRPLFNRGQQKKKKTSPRLSSKPHYQKTKKYLQCFLSLAGNGITEQIKNKKPRLNQRNKKNHQNP